MSAPISTLIVFELKVVKPGKNNLLFISWYGHVLRRDDDSVLRVALNLEVTGKRKRGRPKKTWKKQVEEETEKVGLKKEDALRRDKWRDGVREIAEGMG